MALYYHLFAPFTWVRVTNSTRAQSRGTRTRDTSDTMWAIIYKALGIKRRLFLTYYPEINGATEYIN